MHLIKKTCMRLLYAKEVYKTTGGDCVLYSKSPVWTEYVYKSDGVNFDLVIIVIILYFIHEYCMYKRRNKTLINVQRKLIANSSWRPLKVYDNETAENKIEQRRRTEIT